MRALVFAFLIGVTATAAPKRPADPACEKALTNHESALSKTLFELRSEFHNRLSPYPDPFVNTLTLDEAQRLFDGLSYRSDPSHPGVKVLSVLGQTRQFLNSTQITSLDTAKPIIQEIIKYGEQMLSGATRAKADLYRGSVALDLLLPAIAPFLTPPVEEDSASEKGAQDEKVQKKEKKAQPGEKQPAKYPELDKNYKPHTKDSENKTLSNDPQVILAEVNSDKIPYFIMKPYNSVVRGAAQPFQESALPAWSKDLKSYFSTSLKLKLKLLGKKDVAILLPSGFEPTMMDSKLPGKIKALPSGAYQLQTTMDEVDLSLMPENLQLGPLQLEFLRKKVGFKDTDWPDDIKLELLDRIRDMEPMAAAQQVEAFIRSKYLYSVGARPEMDPIAALKAGAFQCDMAAYIMVGIMRDFLHTPCRPASGFRGQSKKGEIAKSFVSLPGEMHAFVQCFDEFGQAHVFDPTPKKKDKKTKDEAGKNEFQENEKEFKDDKDEEQQEEQSEDSEKSAAVKSKEHKKKLNDNTDKSLKESGQQNKTEAEKGKAGAEAEPIPEDLNKALTQGTLSLKPNRSRGLLENRARHLYLRESLNPSLETYQALQRIQNFKMDQGYDPSVKAILTAAEVALGSRQRPAAEALLGLSSTVKKTDVVRSFQQIVQLEDRLTLYANMQDDAHKAPLLALVADLRKVKKMFQDLNEISKVDTGLALKFFGGLPPHSKQLMKAKYKLTNIGENIETQAMLNDLKSGKLLDYNLIRILFPLTDFIMDSTPTPAFRTVRTWVEDRRFYTGSEFLPPDDLSRAYQAIPMQPLKSVTENMLEGTLFLPVMRQRAQIPDAGGKTDPKRVTIALYDTSGSMSDEPGDFQAALLAAFTDRALSDRSANGFYRHQCLLMGFDDKVHTIHKVTNSNEAYDVIQNFRQKMTNTGRGTNIMAAIREAINQIVEAERFNGEPLASANIILMSDGGSTVETEELRKLLSRVDRKTPIKFMFIAINGTNEQLIELTKQAKAAGAKESFYKMFTGEHIAQLMAEGKKAPRPDFKRELYTQKGPEHLPPGIDSLLSTLANNLNLEIQRLSVDLHPRELPAWAAEMDRTPINPDDEKPTPIKLEINSLRGLLNRSDVFKGKSDVNMIVDDVLKNFVKTFGKNLNLLKLHEREQINHLLNEAIIYARGGGRNRGPK